MGAKFKDIAMSTLAASLGAGDVAFDVAAAEGGNFSSLGTGDWLYLRISNSSFSKWEIVKVETRTVDEMSDVTRNVASSTGAAQAFDAGDQVAQVVPAAQFNLLTAITELFTAPTSGEAEYVLRVNSAGSEIELIPFSTIINPILKKAGVL